MNNEGIIRNPPLPRQYGEALLILERGQGCRLWDRAGRSYLDFGSGIAVNALGHGRDDLAETASKQMKRLIHVSNLFATIPELELAAKMIAAPAPSPAVPVAVHFGNSGSEANETALKYARLYAGKHKGEGHHGLFSFTGSFHGRTMGALSLTSNPGYRKPFEPLLPGASILPFNDAEALKKTLDDDAAAVLVEPLQGEGGLNMVSRNFARTLNILCRRHNILMIADEVQTGLGRCGAFYASELVGLEPDIITLAKPLAGGLPLSAVLIPAAVNDLLKPGHHATTFGGGPVTTAVASVVWDILSDPDLVAETRRKGEFIESLLESGLQKLGVPWELRGAGLLRGLRLRAKDYDGAWGSRVIEDCRREGLLILKSGSDLLRLAPPLVITDEEIEEGVSLLLDIVEKNL